MRTFQPDWSPSRLAAALTGAMLVGTPLAQGPSQAVTIQRRVEAFAATQTSGLAGEVRIAVPPQDARNNLPPCDAMEVFLPPGARVWGRFNAGVRCTAGAAWTIYVPTYVRVFGEYLVFARPISAGQALTEADLVRTRGELSTLPPGVLTNAQDALGRSPALSVPAGQPLRRDMLRAPIAIQQGQSVKLVARGAAFSVSAEGRALANAAEGQTVQVRMASGQTVAGIAREGGQVEMNF